MLYLILAIASSMLVSVCMRLSEGKAKNNISMLAMNYAMCTLLSIAFAGAIDLFPNEEGLGFAVLLGLVSGAMYLGSFMLLQWNIRVNGVVLPATFMKLGVVVPTLTSILAFGEAPGAAQIAGIVLAIAAILLIQLEKGSARAKSAVGLVILLIAGGSTDVLSKIYEEMGNGRLSDQYLLYTFFVALVLCALLAVFKGQRLTAKDIAFGLLVGVPNYFSARFLLLSLGQVSAVVAYPTYSVGTIVLITLVGRAAFHEKLSRRQMLAMGVILAALILLNV
ncbi:MAG: DMT family transporter [Clostridia bacterium]|nr:DMT family transporter [Clostridia bacterium]